MKEFKGRVALITGAANGFGVEFVKEAAKREMKIVAVDIEGDEVKAVAEEARANGAEIIDIQADLTKYEEVEEKEESLSFCLFKFYENMKNYANEKNCSIYDFFFIPPTWKKCFKT